MNRANKILNTETAWEQGLSGRGVTVAVLDTGIALHPDYVDRVICFKDMIQKKERMYDDYGHGTHVTGILAGNGKMNVDLCGIAPGAQIVHVKVLDRNGNGRREDMVEGIKWVIQHRRHYGIRILNISVGTVKEGDKRDEILIRWVEEAWDAGIAVVAAAGNMGPHPYTITAPGVSRKIITVGSSDEMDTATSGRGPTRNCVCKPDIVTPGAGIYSCNHNWQLNGKLYCVKSGTSMATPMVSGAIALLLEKEPELDCVQIKMRIYESAIDMGMEHQRQGWGRLSIPKLLRIRER